MDACILAAVQLALDRLHPWRLLRALLALLSYSILAAFLGRRLIWLQTWPGLAASCLLSSALLTGSEPKLHVYCLTRDGQGVGVERRKEYQYQSLAYNFGGKVAEPFIVTAGPVPAGTPLVVNTHEGQEFDYVIEGTLRFVVNGTELILNPGDSLYFNSGYPHGLQAVGTEPARFLAVVL